YRLEVRSVNSYHDMIEVVSIYRTAKIHWHEQLSSFGSQFDSIHRNATLFNSIGDIELIECLHSIRGDSDPESYRPKVSCSFVHYWIESTGLKANSCTQSANSATNDCNVGHLYE